MNGRASQVYVIIPALNEEQTISQVVRDLLAFQPSSITVVDNGSVDRTAEVARSTGAEVVTEPRRGYGAACLAGLARLGDAHPDDVVVFFDADGSDDPALLPRLVEPIRQGRADLVLASRTRASAEPGALAPAQRFGNWLACLLIDRLWGVRYSDLAPCRAIRLGTLRRLEMADRDYGWTVEMQIRAARLGAGVLEIASRYRRRQHGRSKISGTVVGSLRAGSTILSVIYREWRADRRPTSSTRGGPPRPPLRGPDGGAAPEGPAR